LAVRQAGVLTRRVRTGCASLRLPLARRGWRFGPGPAGSLCPSRFPARRRGQLGVATGWSEVLGRLAGGAADALGPGDAHGEHAKINGAPAQDADNARRALGFQTLAGLLFAAVDPRVFGEQARSNRGSTAAKKIGRAH